MTDAVTLWDANFPNAQPLGTAGNPLVVSNSGGGGGGDASAANQVTGNASLASIDTKTPALGQALAAGSTPIVLTAAQLATLTPPTAITGFSTAANQATELTNLGAVTETAPASDTASSGLNGRLQRIAQRLTSLIALLPASLGQKTKATALAVTLASDEDLIALHGAVTETAPATDTASSGLNGRLQRIAQRITSLIALLPASLGQKAKASALAVTLSSDEDLLAIQGAITETAPASDTASSGLNGRLQRIAQRLTSFIALFPTSIGQKAKAGALAVTLASDEDLLATTGAVADAAVTAGATGSISAKLRSISRDIINAIVLAAGENHIGEVGGFGDRLFGEFTRPADTTAYAANDVVSDNTTTTTPVLLTNALRVNAGTGYIVRASVTTNKKSVTPRIRVHLFNANTMTIAADNAQFKEVYADNALRLGYFDLPAMTTAADTTNSDMSRSMDNTIRHFIKAAAATRNIYYVLETLDAFTPASGELFRLQIFMDNN